MGAPFSSVAERRRIQTLANGTHIDLLETVTRTYRDSQGRTRTEFIAVKPGASPVDKSDFATISDPVAGKIYSLNLRNHSCAAMQYFGASSSVMVTPSINMPGSSSSTVGAWLMSATNPSFNPGQGPHPDAATTSLGDDTIFGVPVTGTRITMVFPVGLVGNDQPITVTRETWESRDLHLILLSKSDDPREGETTVRVTQLDRTEPDPSLFQVPSDFTVVEK
jgi:hypothetical protein